MRGARKRSIREEWAWRASLAIWKYPSNHRLLVQNRIGLPSNPLGGFSAVNSAQDRQCPDPFPGRRVHRVTDGRRKGWNRGLARSAGGLAAFDKVSLPPGDLIHAQGGVVVKVPLHDAPFIDRDHGPQGIRQAVNHSP